MRFLEKYGPSNTEIYLTSRADKPRRDLWVGTEGARFMTGNIKSGDLVITTCQNNARDVCKFLISCELFRWAFHIHFTSI